MSNTHRDTQEHVQTILRKGKLNKEGIKILHMSDQEKQREMNFVLKDMIKQKEEQKEKLKRLSQEEYQLTLQEMLPEF